MAFGGVTAQNRGVLRWDPIGKLLGQGKQWSDRPLSPRILESYSQERLKYMASLLGKQDERFSTKGLGES